MIDKHLTVNKIKSAYALLGYYDGFDDCEEIKVEAENKIFVSHQKYACDKIIQDCRILANSANEAKMNKAIDLLLIIPPDAPCAQEAIEVAELINKNALALNQGKSSAIQNRIVVRNNRSNSD